jgi:quercetin dioxygenase-like cupin family protein
MTATKGFVVPSGGGTHLASPTPGRSFALKLLGHETGESIMVFEETLPAGTTSLYHLHRDSDEVAWVLAGEFTFKIGDEVTVGGPGTCAFMPRGVPHAWKNTGSEPAACCFSTPRPPPAAISRRSRSAARPTTTNATTSSSATAGKSSAQIPFEVGLCAGPAMPSCDQVAVSPDGVSIHMRSTGAGRPRPSSHCNANSCQQVEGEMESRAPSIIDLNAELAKLTMFRGRTPQSTMADRKGSGARLASYRDGVLFATKFAGKGHWERHPTGDELIHVLDGTGTLEIMGEDGSQFFALRAGMIAVNPQGAWHRFHSSEGVTVMFATPNPSEHINLDVDDPRRVERQPA